MIDGKKICFISCVNNDLFYEECLRYIKNLNIPYGYTVETISIKDAKSMCEGYNAAMEASDAKYKVYLHQDVFIINKNFISDILKVFKDNENIGMIGMCGAETIPTNAVWWEAVHKYGKVYENHTGEMESLAFDEVNDNYHSVKALDGLIMVTQYNLPWREDIFDGWHFYDISQCTEFVLAGYEVVVPNQKIPWCIHECGLVNTKNGYEMYKNIFLKEYSKKIFPLVSILIPAYNQTKYLKEALESAINQTYFNIEIVIGDDSTNDEVEKFIKPYLMKYDNIEYFKNSRREMDYGISNVQMLFKKSKGEYINYLNHDDVFHITKIEKMVDGFIKNPNVNLVTSVRQPIDEFGNKLPLDGAFSELFKKNTIIGGHELSSFVVNKLTNFIGEPTTVLFKKRYIENGKYGEFNESKFFNIMDVAVAFTLLQYGDALYISETLSYFRRHSNQNSNKPSILVKGIIEWYALIEESFKVGIIKNTNEYKIILNKWLNSFIPAVNVFIKNNNYVDDSLKVQLENAYKLAINKLMFYNANYKYECPICNNRIERFLPYQYKEHISDYVTKFEIIGSDMENFTCPECNCHDRARHLVMYFNKLNIWNEYIVNKKVLHMAPEIHLQKIISNLNVKEYVCGDLYPINASITKIDITDIQFDNNYFDFIICNHVLEHIPNDLLAMKQLYRVLKVKGCAILQTPYSPILKKSFEDIKINTDIKRKEFFGQVDHVRVYGVDFFERLESVGFSIKEIKNKDLFSEEESKKYGFNDKENLILLLKE